MTGKGTPMKKPLAIILLIIFGNAFTLALGGAAWFFVRMPWVIIFVTVGHAALSVIFARQFKRKFALGYRKIFFFGALPAFVISAVSGFFIFGADSFNWIASMFAFFYSIAYCFVFGGVLLIVWGRETYGK